LPFTNYHLPIRITNYQLPFTNYHLTITIYQLPFTIRITIYQYELPITIPLPHTKKRERERERVFLKFYHLERGEREGERLVGHLVAFIKVPHHDWAHLEHILIQ